MIIKSISAENFGKFDRYSVNLDDNINVFYGDNEAGKTTLYEIISILLFAPITNEEMEASNKLIKTDEKYARVYAIINIDGKEISVAREIYVNDTNLSIADKEDVSSLGNVNVPFIGDLSKEMYESFHTIDYYNMATITNNVWQQIIKVIEESHGAKRVTPDFSSPEDEKIEKQKSKFEDQIKEKEQLKDELTAKLKEAQKKQKRMIKNQDKIDDLINDLEDVENNIELESSYLKEAEKMNQIRSTIKKTQDLTLELEKYKHLKDWMPNLKKNYDRLKLYTENKANGIENPIDMFDDDIETAKAKEEKVVQESLPEEIKEEKDMQADAPKQEQVQEAEETKENIELLEAEEEKVEQIVEKAETEVKQSAEKAKEDTIDEKPVEPVEIKEDKTVDEIPETVIEQKEPEIAAAEEEKEKQEEHDFGDFKLPTEHDYDLAKEKINKFIEESYLNSNFSINKNTQDPYADGEEEEEPAAYEPEENLSADNEVNNEDDIKAEDEQEEPIDVKPLEIRKPKSKSFDEDERYRGVVNSFGQTNPYSDNIYPDMDDVTYSVENVDKEADDDNDSEENKYSLSSSEDLPTQTKRVAEKDMNNKAEKAEDSLLKAEEFLNSVNMQEIISLSKQEVEAGEEAQEEIDKAKLRYNIIAKRVFGESVSTDEISQKLKKLDTNIIYKAIVKYKEFSQQQRKLEFDMSKQPVNIAKEPVSGMAVGLGMIALVSMMIGMFCFFIDQIVLLFPKISILNIIYEVIMDLPLNNVVPGNVLAGGAFVLISILLIVAIFLGNDSGNVVEQTAIDEVELDGLKNDIRAAKREVIDALKDFPIPSSYLDNPNNTIISVINELREADSVYHDLIMDSTMPKDENYRTLWKLSRKHLDEDELTGDLFDNISKLRRKIQDYKTNKAEKDKRLSDARKSISMVASASTVKDDNLQDSQLDNMISANNANNIPSPNQSQTTNNFSFETSAPQGNPVKNASESTSFGIPQFQTSTSANDANYSENSTPDAPKDLSYSGGDSSFAAPSSIKYPGDETVLGTAKDIGYSGDQSSSSASEADYLLNDAGTADSGNDFGIPGINRYTNDAPEQKTEAASQSPYDIPGVNRYTNDAPAAPTESAEDNSFGIPGIKKYTDDTPAAPTENAEDNSFGIPGIKKYTDDTPAAPTENAEDNSLGIPGIKKYTDDTPTAPTESADDNPYGIPGIKKYTNDTPAVPTEGASENPFGIPGVNKYGSDTFKEAEENTNENPFNIPGVNKYTNDSFNNQEELPKDNPFLMPDAAKQNPAQEDKNSQNDPFDIPGVKRYTHTEEPEKEDAKETASAIAQPVQQASEPIAAAQEKASEADPFGIPGIKKYSYEEKPKPEDTEVKVQDVQEHKVPSGLPGLDKFSNRGSQASMEAPKSEVKEEIAPPIVPLVVEPVEVGSAAVAGAAAVTAGTLSGLPGLDKFSNRNQQNKAEEKQSIENKEEKPPVESKAEEKPSVEIQIDEKPMEEDPFSIPKMAQDTVGEKETTEIETAEEKAEAPAEETKVIEEQKSDEADAQQEAKEEIVKEEPVEEKPAVVEEKPVAAKDRREREYDKLLELLGSDPEGTIRDVEEITRELHKAIINRDEAMGGLLKLNDAAVRLSTLSSNKWPYKQKAIEASIERIDYLEADKLKLNRHLEMLKGKIEEVDYEDTPQAIADKLKALDEEINQLKLENDKHAIAEELIEKQRLLDMSSSDDRSHIIDDTSEYMKELTLGKYVQVRINEDQSGLSICDKDGVWFDTTRDRLSQATREQLYLALRISIADLFDEKSLIFPMFFDEALITWDKRRMKAVMRLLSKMSMHRQVIIFTCHDWLKDMISDYLIGAKIILM